MKKFVFGLLLLLSLPVYAATVTVTWTMPTQYTDSSAITPTDIASTTVEYGTCNGTAFGTSLGMATASAPATTLVINNLSAGSTYCFRAYVTMTSTAGGQSSSFSNVASKSIPPKVPSAPIIVTIS